jgi:hypothetical protein
MLVGPPSSRRRTDGARSSKPTWPPHQLPSTPWVCCAQRQSPCQCIRERWARPVPGDGSVQPWWPAGQVPSKFGRKRRPGRDLAGNRHRRNELESRIGGQRRLPLTEKTTDGTGVVRRADAGLTYGVLVRMRPLMTRRMNAESWQELSRWLLPTQTCSPTPSNEVVEKTAKSSRATNL